MLDSASELLRERGANAVTVDAVLARSGAPRGSVYHHFPGGRDEIVLSALRQSGDFISAMLQRAVSEGDSRQAIDRFIRFWKRMMTESDFHSGCPVVAVAVDDRRDLPEVAQTVRAILDRWHADLSNLLVAEGYPTQRVERLATVIVAAVEGAIILCRVRGDVEALDDVAAEINLLLERR
ncbi:MAG: TetR/AcrR family transcriptional regulator [Candidatus Nanopelagicales bacterium]